MVARIPSSLRPMVKPATGIRLFWSVMRKRFRANIPPLRRASIRLRVVPVGALGALGAIFFDHLVHAHTTRDHGVHVRLRVDVEVQDRTSRLLLCPPDCRLDVVAFAYRLSG